GLYVFAEWVRALAMEATEPHFAAPTRVGLEARDAERKRRGVLSKPLVDLERRISAREAHVVPCVNLRYFTEDTHGQRHVVGWWDTVELEHAVSVGSGLEQSDADRDVGHRVFPEVDDTSDDSLRGYVSRIYDGRRRRRGERFVVEGRVPDGGGR